MGEVNAKVELKLSIADSYAAVLTLVRNPRFLEIYKDVHSGKEYSGKVIEATEHESMVITESVYDSMSKLRHKGWTIAYQFAAIDETHTRISVSVRYGWFLALMGMTTTNIQAKNELMGRISALLALDDSNSKQTL